MKSRDEKLAPVAMFALKMKAGSGRGVASLATSKHCWRSLALRSIHRPNRNEQRNLFYRDVGKRSARFNWFTRELPSSSVRATFSPPLVLYEMGFEIVLGFCYQFDRSDQPDIQRIFHVPLSSRSQERNEDCNFSSSTASVACIQRNPLCDWKVGSADIRWKYRFPPARLSIFFSLLLPSHAPFSYQTFAPPLLAESYKRGSSVLGKKARSRTFREKRQRSIKFTFASCSLRTSSGDVQEEIVRYNVTLNRFTVTRTRFRKTDILKRLFTETEQLDEARCYRKLTIRIDYSEKNENAATWKARNR